VTASVVEVASLLFCLQLEIAEIGWAGAGGHYHPDNNESSQQRRRKQTETDATRRQVSLIVLLSKDQE